MYTFFKSMHVCKAFLPFTLVASLAVPRPESQAVRVQKS